ncbi:hypothetical protein JQN58_19360 [Aneurinibacillus sp. BA2021]|nr:hypothetical protein [Aneurinibacillus sp. BA2021]
MRQKALFFVAGVLALSLGGGQGAAFFNSASSPPAPKQPGDIPPLPQHETAKQLVVQAMRNQAASHSFHHDTAISIATVYMDGKKDESIVRSTGDYTKTAYHETSRTFTGKQEKPRIELYYADSHLYVGRQEGKSGEWQWRMMKTPQNYAEPAFETNVLPFPFGDVSQLQYTRLDSRRIAFQGQLKDKVPASVASVGVNGILTLDASHRYIVQAQVKERVTVHPDNKKTGQVRETVTDRTVSFYNMNEPVTIHVPQEAKEASGKIK